ncbi:COP9 signalosome complex subunit 6-like, putative [Bodo saltans]|uniref:COP9 signalosome complex subunit 6-like, putative n=1 Tax=Bodo saltans TaxID=75058 RepID=A0A0S4JS98_BODSA|nr:COP9 signalosome complex subunit 6-like, putative [Bodo saltans]|eukprot:CUG93453.1 COP9 signalosome complex subunit 6-like, putative [Bodo saltans]
MNITFVKASLAAFFLCFFVFLFLLQRATPFLSSLAMQPCFTQPAESLTAHPPLIASQIAVHPLAIMSMSDHWTRSSSIPQSHADNGGVLGILLGHLLDGKLSVVASFEVLVDRQCESHVSIDEEKVREHVERLQEVYQGVDVVGWYTFGERLRDPIHSTMHSRLAAAFQNDALLLLLMSTTRAGKSGHSTGRATLPLYAFELRNKTTSDFQQVAFAVEAEELETIGINAAIQAELQASSDPNAATTAAASRLTDASGVLKDCVRTLVSYLTAVEQGRLEPDVELLRRVGTLCNRLPVLPTDASSDATSQLSAAQQREHVNSLMTLYLGALASLQAASGNLAADIQSFADGRHGLRR